MMRHLFIVIALAACFTARNGEAKNFTVDCDGGVPDVGRKAAKQVEQILEECFTGAILDEPAYDPPFESTTFIPVMISVRQYEPGIDGSSADIDTIIGRPAQWSVNDHGVSGCPGTPNDVAYPLALANQLAGENIAVRFNLSRDAVLILYPRNRNLFWTKPGCEFWAEESGLCPANKIDLVTLLLHEAVHGMGFADVVDPETGWSSWRGSDLKYRPAKYSCDGHVTVSSEMEDFPFSYRGTFTENQEQANASQRCIGLDGFYDLVFTGAKTRNIGGFSLNLYNSNPAISGRTLLHWSTEWIAGVSQLMYWELGPGTMRRSLDFARGVMRDLGWKLKDETTIPKHANTDPKAQNSNKSLTDTAVRVIVSENTGVTRTVNSITLTGQNADQFQIVQGGGLTTLAAWKECPILVAHAPTTTGYHTAQLQVTLTDAVHGTRTLTSSFTGYGIEEDSDGDGMSDVDETRDLQPDTPGVNNPFNAAVEDSTGDRGATASDGLPDGQNDYDGDGMSNEMEFFFGYNPMDPLSVGFCTDNDTDGDGLPDAAERRYNTPFDPYCADTSGDDWSTDPDNIPDGWNDYDGDGFSNNYELRWGSDPTDENSVPAKVPAAGGWAVSLAVALIILLGLRTLAAATAKRTG